MYNIRDLISNITTDWKDILFEIYNENVEYFETLEKFLKKEDETYDGISKIFPPQDLIFNSFNQCNLKETNVIIIGQDPYHQQGQAMGLCFSVPNGIPIPPSLKNIYKELCSDLNGDERKYLRKGDLIHWSSQGILLLNTALTVRESKPASHSKIWAKFIELLLNKIAEKEFSKSLIVMLWGNHAKKYKKYFHETCYFLEATHPSPLGANRGGWFGTGHFSKCNNILADLNKSPIIWLI